ncbi:MAG: serine/threonine-protein kinase [Candidatus Sumerlaeota bacterium]|nr:serine/threonine-protein kinase [Candidatus Sumerlaeota bacterium]
MLKVGHNLGEYIVERPISVGKTGQADVYLARRADGTGSPVALKVLAEHLKTDDDALRNFSDEADVLTKLHHPGIVRLESFDTSPPTPYIAQEYVEGQSTADWLKSFSAPASIDAILGIALQVADALLYAHGLTYFKIEQTETGGKSSRKRQGLIHRDLSTDNILITKDQKAKLIDFGIAKAIGITTVTTRNTSLGKEYYVAHEVEIGVGRTSLPAADIYSFGVCLYEMVMMYRPEKQRLDVLKQFQRNLHALHLAFPDDVPDQLKKLIVHCVQREPRDRPKSMNEVKLVLLELQSKSFDAEASNKEIPVGLVASSRALRLARVLALPREETGGGFMRLAFNDNGTRFFLLCDECAKVCSFNESGGEKQTRHVPHGQHLAAIAGGKDDEAFGFSVEGANLLVVDASGEWRSLVQTVARGLPKVVPDNIAYYSGSIYMGDYTTNRIFRMSLADGQITGGIPEGLVTQLGPFGLGNDSLFFIDMASKTLFRTDLSLQNVRKICTEQSWGWPTWLAAGDALLFIVDSQNKKISVLTTDGEMVDPRALTWSANHEISQVSFAPRSSQIVILDSTSPGLLFFDVMPVDPELLRLARALRLPTSEIRDFSYETIEQMMLNTIHKSPDKREAALRAITCIDNSAETRKKGLRIQAVLYNFLLENASPVERPSILRRLSGTLEQMDECEKAKQVCQEYLNAAKGYDPDIRDRYGRLLEKDLRWEDIKEFEGVFLSQAYFGSPDNRVAYSRSYNRVRKAYANLGIPLPKNFNIPPTAELMKANALLNNRQYDEARALFKEIIDNEGYTLVKGEDAIAILAGYAKSIKHSMRLLSLEDWQEIHRRLSILVRDYSQTQGFKPEFTRDMSAAARQIEKLNGLIPRAEHEQ